MLSPGSLLQISAEFIQDNLSQQLLEEVPTGLDKNAKNRILWKGKNFKLRGNIALPDELWELLLQSHKRVSSDHIFLFIGLADSQRKCAAQKLVLRNAWELSDDVLESLLVNCPKVLDIHNCPLLTPKTFMAINKYGKNLEVLVIGSSVQILPIQILRRDSEVESKQENSAWSSLLQKLQIPTMLLSLIEEPKHKATQITDSYESLKTPRLKKLVIWGHQTKQKQEGLLSVQVDYWKILTKQFIQNLIFLDLSYCQEFEDFSFLLDARDSLEQLIIHDVLIPNEPLGWEVLKQITNLRLLDVSQSMELASVYNQPDVLMRGIVNSLPNLSSLDISGTNLAGHGSSGIAGLESRVNSPLDFIGLLGSHYNACRRLNIHAKVITGSSNEKQLMESLNRYIERPGMLKKAFRMLFGKLIKANDFDFIQPCINLTIEALEIHVDDKHVVLVGLCVLFNLMKRLRTSSSTVSDYVELYFTSKLRKRIVSVAVKAANAHAYDLTLLRNAFLVLCLLDIQHDLVPILSDLVDLLLRSIELAVENSDYFLMRTSYYLLKPIIGLATLEDRKCLGAAGAVKRLCAIADTSIVKDISDHMPSTWMILEYLTDDNDANCDAFIKAEGLDIFMRLKTKMPHGTALAAGMGVLTNVANVPANRPYFMKEEFIWTIFELMKQPGQDFVGFDNYRRLGYAASWCMMLLLLEPHLVKHPNKSKILEKLQKLIISWDVRHNMGIELTSLTPLMTALQAPDLECRAFAIWTLAHLINLQPSKYVSMIGDCGQFLSLCTNSVGIEDGPFGHHVIELVSLIRKNI